MRLYYLLVFALEVGSEDAFAYRCFYLWDRPETTAVCLFTGMDGAVVGSTEGEDQFAFAVGLKDVMG